jgi:hypothetical protein
MTACTILVLVLGFGLLREVRLGPSWWLLRWQCVATAAGLAAGIVSSDRAETIARVGGVVVLALLAWRGGAVLGGLERRSGGATARPRSAIPLIGLGLGLTALAAFELSDAAYGPAVAREAVALGLAACLVGLLSAARGGAPALWLARFGSFGNGLVLLAAADGSTALIGAAVLLLPVVTLAAVATIGRAGGLPNDGALG